jgi:hypothetical protein
VRRLEYEIVGGEHGMYGPDRTTERLYGPRMLYWNREVEERVYQSPNYIFGLIT